ncbi:MAG: hypothetical protein VZR09_07730 [Candidatus Gastranaerophilaceae bacterium]|nr:hypothetical protein [Candidatus Gastranaerophilaceae bacterium]
MSKPINPDIAIPSEFAADGQKRNFTEEKIQHGFNSVAKDTLEGDCLNKFIDDTYKGLNYAMDGVDDLYDVTDTKADDSAVVHLTGNETILGAKIFSGSIATGRSNFVAISGTNIYIKNGTPAVTITALNGHLVEDGNKVIDVTDLATTYTAGIVQPDGSTINVASGVISAPLATLDFINNSKALETGTASSNATILADVVNYAHSTFDLSKFDVAGSPTITDDGIASGFSGSNGIYVPTLTPGTSSWEIGIEQEVTAEAIADSDASFVFFTDGADKGVNVQCGYTNSSYDSFTVYAKNVTGTGASLNCNSSGNGKCVVGDKQKLVLGYDAPTNIAYFKAYKNGVLYASSSVTALGILQQDATHNTIGFRRGLRGTKNKINLKTYYVKINGVLVYSGNKTGTDTYTIGGNIVTIPYTLSKTGSKIVDGAYRTGVTAIYNEQGYAPYYTLDEANGNFTLPQGEIYGMMLNQSVPHVIESYKNGSSWYRVWSDGWCEQGGGVYIAGATGGGDITLLKAYSNIDYSVMLTNSNYLVNSTPGVTPDSKTTTGFSVDYPTAEAVSDVYWETKGYINI